MTVVMVVARERTEYWRPASPTSQAIDRAFAAVNVGSWGRWIGPAPRIVRVVYDFTNAAEGQYGIYTYAAQPFEIAAAMDSHATYVLQQLLAALDAQLGRIESSAWEPAQVAVYDPARNGPLTWWQSGQARTSETRDLQERAFASFRANNRENPVGPTSSTSSTPGNPTPSPDLTNPGTAPPSIPNRLDDAGSSLREFATRWGPWLLLGGVVVLGLAFLPEITAANRARRAFVAESNPTRGRRRRRTQRNPRGRAAVWDVAPAGTAYDCKSPLVGQIVPGRGGGMVRACATPSRKKPRSGQVYLIPETGRELAPGTGWTMPKSRAARRLRDAKKPRTKGQDVAYLHEAHEAFRATGLPAPSGLEWPHVAGSSRCDPEHPVWSGYDDAVEDARERAAIMAEDGDELDYERAFAQTLERAPQFPAWRKQARACADSFNERQASKRGKADTTERERSRLMKEFRDLPEDVAMQRAGGLSLSEALDRLREGKAKPKSAPRSLRAKAKR